ncbi:MAG: non-ribosomal peptide synthetase [Actinomycetota bacterium]
MSHQVPYQLSPVQQGMFFHHLKGETTGVDIQQVICTCYEPFKLSTFLQAWQQVLQRHPILRTSFEWSNSGEPLQTVHPQVELPIVQEDWRHLSPDDRSQTLQTYLHRDRQQGFDLATAPLLRLAFFQLTETDYQFICTFHHILLDSHALLLLFQELFAIYQSYCQNQDPQLPDPPPYQHYIQWLQQQDLSAAETYWKQTLRGFTTPTPPIASQLGKESDEIGSTTAELQLSPTLTASLTTLAQTHHFTLPTLLSAVWALLLSRYSGETDVVFGHTRSGRQIPLPGAEFMVGFLMNTLPLRVQIPPEMPVLPWLQTLQTQWDRLQPYEHTPLMQAIAWSDIPRGTSLFETLVNFEAQSLDSALQTPSGRSLRNIQLLEQTSFPLNLYGYGGPELLLKIQGDSQRYDRETLTRMLGHLHTLLAAIAANPQQPLCELPLLTAAEQQQLCPEWHPTPTQEPQACLHELFEAQVERSPNAIALSFDSHTLTYQALNQRANQIAHHLQSLGVGPEVLVGLCVERSIEMVVGILAILKAGGAYLPLDPAYPKDRLAFMLADAEVSVLLTQPHLVAELPEHSATICLLEADPAILSDRPNSNPVSHATPNNLAYVIYTSGSTGKPKGVLVNHANVTRLFVATQPLYHFSEQDVWTLFHSYAFDFSVWEMWGAFLYGGRLVIVPYWLSRAPEAFYHLLREEQVTVLNQTPSAFHQLILAEESVGTAPDLKLRLVIFGGEALELPSLKPWFDRHGDRRPQLVNMYGITETTVFVTYRPLSQADLSARGSAIGIAIPDWQVYLLDRHRQPVPLGIAGEIYVGGAGVTRGYLRRPELTAERFISNPFSHSPEAKLYKSGDLARYLPNGELEYLGRIDDQVKVRGFRIELGEIEAVLWSHPAIKQAVVIAREDDLGDKRLVAYLVTDGEQEFATAQLRPFLAAELPDYMIPSQFVTLPVMPLTPNGKIDRRALPIPEPQHRQMQQTYVAPQNQLETALANLWCKLLKFDRVSIHDNFFELGGNSLLSLQMVAQIRQELKINLPVVKLFQYSTICSLANYLNQGQSESSGFEQAQDRAERRKSALARRRSPRS